MPLFEGDLSSALVVKFEVSGSIGDTMLRQISKLCGPLSVSRNVTEGRCMIGKVYLLLTACFSLSAQS
jgi:hypothetical protein